MKIRKFRLETSFMLPFTDVRQASGLLEEIRKRIRAVVGPDIKVNTSCRRVHRIFGARGEATLTNPSKVKSK